MSRQSHRVVPRPTFARLVAAFVGALSMLATLVAVDTVNPAGAAVAKTFYVAPTRNNSAAGTAAAPYRTIKKAVARASSGDTIVLRDGVFRESVYIYGKAIRLESAQGERAVMEGARAVGGFRSSAQSLDSQQHPRSRAGRFACAVQRRRLDRRAVGRPDERDERLQRLLAARRLADQECHPLGAVAAIAGIRLDPRLAPATDRSGRTLDLE